MSRGTAARAFALEQHQEKELVCSSNSAEETRALGAALAAHLAPGDVICLYGDLGAGKTTFVQGLAQGLGVSRPVTSPSFTLVHEHRGRLLFYHLDLYRLEADDLLEAGIEEVLGANAVVAVEWAERLPADLRRGALEIEIRFDEENEDRRELRFRARGERGVRMIADMSQESDADPRP
jgi:tRNA threonylcarbamoyladenosine biosynthesis protein TsaE